MFRRLFTHDFLFQICTNARTICNDLFAEDAGLYHRSSKPFRAIVATLSLRPSRIRVLMITTP